MGGPGVANVSPALAWANAPANTQSFAVIVDDPTARNWTHWVLFNIPAAVRSIPEGGTAGTAGANDFPGARAAYDGPCPPVAQGKGGGSHTYYFTVLALSVPSIPVAPGATRATVQAALAPFVVASARVEGTYP
jgi:Raf kinase inhibitor-like YbhB/YbcL family protein